MDVEVTYYGEVGSLVEFMQAEQHNFRYSALFVHNPPELFGSILDVMFHYNPDFQPTMRIYNLSLLKHPELLDHLPLSEQMFLLELPLEISHVFFPL